MQMMVKGKGNSIDKATKEWLKEAAIETFTAKELEKMADQKRKKKAPTKKAFGIAYGLPEGYDSMW